jgi:hypothetical protein
MLNDQPDQVKSYMRDETIGTGDRLPVEESIAAGLRSRVESNGETNGREGRGNGAGAANETSREGQSSGRYHPSRSDSANEAEETDRVEAVRPR